MLISVIVPLALLLAFVEADAKSEYNSICDDPPIGEEREITKGLYGQFHCDSNGGSGAGVKYTKLAANTIKECAVACADRHGKDGTLCVAIIWATKTAHACWGVEESTVPDPDNYTGGLYVILRDDRGNEKDDLFPEDEPDVLFPEDEETLEECKEDHINMFA